VAALASLAIAGCGSDGHKRATAGLVLERNGLLTQQAFDKSAPTSSLTPAFTLGGTAGPSNGSVRPDPDGLHVGVGPHRLGTWQGYFATTSATYPANSVIHVRMWRPQASFRSEDQSGIALLAVQTASSKALNYVLVAGVMSPGKVSWIVGYANGNTAYSNTRLLETVPSNAANQAVTLRTDGNSHYAVYFGSKRVYESSKLDLGVAPPFEVYLEVEARGVPYQVRFQNLWVTADNTVTVDGLHPGDRVTLTPVGDPPVQALANGAGRAQLTLPPSEAVGTGTLAIDGPGVRRRFAGVRFAGGDVYKVGG
jgi:hypothetical protein